MRIRQKLLVASLLPVVLLTGIGMYATSVGRRVLRENIDNESMRHARHVMDAVDREMHQRITQWKGYVETLTVQTWLKRSNFAFEQESNLQELIAETEANWPDSDLAKDLRDNNSVSSDMRNLQGRTVGADATAIFAEVLLTNQYGVNVAQTHITSDYQQNDEEWWTRAVEDGLFIQDVAFDESAGTHTIGICIRVDGDEDQLLGVLRAALSLHVIAELIDSRSGVDSEHSLDTVTLFTSDRRVIRRSYAEQPPLYNGGEFLPAGARVDADFAYERGSNNSGLKPAIGAVAVSTGYGDFAGNGSFVSVEREVAELLSPIETLNRRILIICGAAAGVCLILGFVVTRTIAQRIDKLDQASYQVGAGNLGLQVEVDGNDELSNLARTFNAMSANLEFEHNLLRTLMTHLPDAIYFKDVSGKYLRVSQALARRFALDDPADARGRSDADFFTPEELKRIDSDEESVLTSGDSSVGVVEQRTWPDGTTTWVSTTRALLRNAGNELIGTFGISHDVSQLKETEQQLADVAVRLSLPRVPAGDLTHEHRDPVRLDQFSLQDMISCGSFIRGLSMECPTREDFADQLVRYLYDRIVDADGEPAFALVRLFQTQPYGELDEDVQQIASSMAGDTPLEADTVCLSLLGTVGREEAWNHPRRSAGHRVIPLPSVEVVRQLPMIAQLFKQLGFEVEGLLAGTGSLLVDDLRTGVFHVPRAEGSKYIPAQDFVKQNGVHSVVGFGDVLPNGELFAVICFSRVPVSEQIGLLFSHLSISTKLALLPYIESDTRVQSQIMAVDQLLRNYEEVVCEQESRLRTTMEELAVARDAANLANKTKSDFLANMSHEIRTPMNAVIGMTELVLDSELQATQRSYLATVLDSAESLLTIINEILDFSKIEAGHLELESTAFDLRDVMGDIAKSVALRAHRRGLELACRVDPEAPRVVIGDPARLRQVIVNLVGNAIKFTHQGEILVSVQCMSVEGGRACLRFRVRDTGIGIPQDKLDTIFEAFQQADTSTTREYGGTGLGLSISSTLVRLMGGRINVKSKIGDGSQFAFTLTLPVGADDAVLKVSPFDPEVLHELPIVVVDDNTTNLKILEEVLGNWGMRVTVLESARAALTFLRGVKAAGGVLPLVLTDINMPDMDGYELCRQIRGDDTIAETALIVLTSGDRTSDAGQCEAMRIAAWLMKPAKQSELLNAVMTAVAPDMGNASDSTSSFESPLGFSTPLNILLAEDGKANQRLAVGLLEQRLHSVTVANNGADAVKLWETQNFDLILMDVQMPELDGLEATREIRTREQSTGSHIPIIAMTAHALKGDRERCLESGMDDYVAKPIRRQELFDAIQAAVSETEPVSAGPTRDDSVDEPPSPDNADEPDSTSEGTTATVASSGNATDDLAVDWDLAIESVGGDVELLKDVVNAFLEECPDLIEQLEQSIEARDAAALQRLAHTIKGSMRLYEVPAICRLAETVEDLAAVEQFEQAATAVRNLRHSLELVLPELARFANS